MSLLITELGFHRGFEGPQIIVSFKMPDESVDKVRVVRKVLDYPSHETDGVIVQDDIIGALSEQKFVSDRNLTGNDTYYYKVFSLLGLTWTSSVNTRGNLLAIQTGFFQEHLHKLFPDIYRLVDVTGV